MVAGLAVSGGAEFRVKDVSIFRPYPDEIPWELLLAADPNEARVLGYADADYMRVAKFRDEAIGVYVVQARSATCFELCNLSVADPYRHKGLGRWLLGHAIGLSETKGAREIVIEKAPFLQEGKVLRQGNVGLFERTGFVPSGAGLLLVLTPE